MTDAVGPGDWSADQQLGEALPGYLRDADVALEAIAGVVDVDTVVAFTCERVATFNANGESLWQEVALTDGARLILWHGDDDVDEVSGEPIFATSIRTVPLTSIADQGLRNRYSYDAEGNRTLHTVTLFLATQTPERSTTELNENAGTSTLQFVETFHFSKSITDGGRGQMDRLIDFARVLSKATIRR